MLDIPGPPEDPNHEIMTDCVKTMTLSLNIQGLVRIYGVSPAILLYAASAIVLGEISETEDVIFGLTLSGRDLLVR